MRSLYPSIEPYAVHGFDVDQPHQIHVEECGNPHGVPVIFLHGGPGSGCNAEHRRYFDPDFYRIILFDQRGSGRSRPLGETSRNRTSDLVADMERIRDHLEIPRWLLFGGSWGATLALDYAFSHPNRVQGMVLRGTFLARESDLDWFFVGLKRLFPQAWERFSGVVPDCADLCSLIDGYHALLHGENPLVALDAARGWSEWGSRVVNWHRGRDTGKANPDTETRAHQERLLAKARIETHYARHRYFIEENAILARIHTLPLIPVTIVHGRFDLVCTMDAAWALHRAIPGSRLVQVADAGHLIDEPSMAAALVEETDRMRGLF
jgi:proline iminopeptidase